MTDTTKKPDRYDAIIALETLTSVAGDLIDSYELDVDLTDSETLEDLAGTITAAARTLALHTGLTSPTLALVLAIDGPTAD